jgi:hypothetical protein
VFDVDQDGFYDAGLDVVDDPNHPGFAVRAPVGGAVAPAAQVGPVLPWLGLAMVVGVLGLTAAAIFGRTG